MAKLTISIVACTLPIFFLSALKVTDSLLSVNNQPRKTFSNTDAFLAKKTNNLQEMATLDVINALNNELKNRTDPNSFSEPDKFRVQHIHLSLFIDFSKQILSGHTILTVKHIDSSTKTLLLDTWDLTIFNVYWLDGTKKVPLKHQLSPEIPNFGSKFEIDVSQVTEEVFKLKIDYSTNPQSSGLLWMTPEMTNGKLHPFMFSQFEAITARSGLPCQDTPSVKAPYTAELEAPNFLVPLMSAKIEKPATNKGSNMVHYFSQPIPIPSYLIAIVCGDLVSKQLGPRSAVWAERGVVEKAAWEFAEVDKILKTAEEVAGPYEWGKYDLLVLPPSFPFGGMENPCLTFVTPTLLAGDRSLVDVVAHEISHSWTGNLVTNANFEHFWLNEGFTVFLERKIIGRIEKGEKSREFAALEGLEELKSTINDMGRENRFTDLVVDLKGYSADSAFSLIPYEKGHTFLFYLEQLLGGPQVFEPFLRAYIQHFKFKSIVTDDFKQFLVDYFKESKAKQLAEIDWDRWLFTPGMPPVVPDYDQTLAMESIHLAEKWLNATDNGSSLSAEDFKALNSPQQKLFLLKLDDHVRNSGDSFCAQKMQVMVEKYRLHEVINAEVRCSWLNLGLKCHFDGSIQDAVKFVSEQGRMKYLNPIYKNLHNWPKTKQLALDTFNANKSKMMKIAIEHVAVILGVKP